MKNKFAIKTTALLICLTSFALSAFSVTAMLSSGEKPVYAAYDGTSKDQTRITMKVCTSVLSIYGTPELSGPAVATRSKGDRLTVSTEDGVIYKIHTSSGVLGYCHAGGLIYTDTKTYAALPYLWEYVEEVVTPDGSDIPEDNDSETDTAYGETDAKGTSDPETKTVLKYSDLVDVNFFAYEKDSVLGANADSVMLQRSYLKKLESLKNELDNLGLTVFVKTGYALTPPEGVDITSCPASVKSGALATLAFKDTTGTEYLLTAELCSLLENAGILRVGESSVFYLENYNDYLCPVFTSADLIYMIYG